MTLRKTVRRCGFVTFEFSWKKRAHEKTRAWGLWNCSLGVTDVYLTSDGHQVIKYQIYTSDKSPMDIFVLSNTVRYTIEPWCLKCAATWTGENRHTTPTIAFFFTTQHIHKKYKFLNFIRRSRYRCCYRCCNLLQESTHTPKTSPRSIGQWSVQCARFPPEITWKIFTNSDWCQELSNTNRSHPYIIFSVFT